jgi:hypothetical protein
MTIDEMRAALDAFERDQVIRCRQNVGISAWELNYDPLWNFRDMEYSPVPKLRVYLDGSRSRSDAVV